MIHPIKLPHCIFAALVSGWMLIGLPVTLAMNS